MFYVYIIQSLKDQSFYIGYSADPDKRLEKHNNSNTGYTASKKPWKLVFSERFNSKKDAIKRERFIKRQKSRSFILQLIENEGNDSAE